MSDQLNPEEREIMEKFQRGELRRVAGAEGEMETARHAARMGGDGPAWPHVRKAKEPAQ